MAARVFTDDGSDADAHHQDSLPVKVRLRDWCFEHVWKFSQGLLVWKRSKQNTRLMFGLCLTHFVPPDSTVVWRSPPVTAYAAPCWAVGGTGRHRKMRVPSGMGWPNVFHEFATDDSSIRKNFMDYFLDYKLVNYILYQHPREHYLFAYIIAIILMFEGPWWCSRW